MPIKKDDGDFVNALARGLSVIRCFGKESPELSLAEISQSAGLTRATARRFLLTLESLGYVSTNGKLFRLTVKALELGYSYLSSLPFWETALPPMQRLVDRLNESCSLGVLDGTDVAYVLNVPPNHLMNLHVQPGTRLPAYATSMGRVLLADLSSSELDKVLKQIKFKRFTSRTVSNRPDLLKVLEGVKKRGYAVLDQELEKGLRAISVPVRSGQRVVAAMTVGAHSARVSESQMTSYVLPTLKLAASEIERTLTLAPARRINSLRE
jgi:IclR family pca regulon transcriptional regulator